MKQHHSWTIEELESMMPWEREIYVGLLVKHIKEENEQTKQQERKINR